MAKENKRHSKPLPSALYVIFFEHETNPERFANFRTNSIAKKGFVSVTCFVITY